MLFDTLKCMSISYPQYIHICSIINNLSFKTVQDLHATKRINVLLCARDKWVRAYEKEVFRVRRQHIKNSQNKRLTFGEKSSRLMLVVAAFVCDGPEIGIKSPCISSEMRDIKLPFNYDEIKFFFERERVDFN